MLEQFHFLEPLWLLALLPLMVMFWLAFQTNTDSRAWEKIIDAKLLPLLLQGKDTNSNKFPKFLLAIVWIIAVLALADPVWEKIPRPIFQTNAARVIVLDLSNSMLIDDLKPSRLARARFKIEDILSREEEGQTGLVLFAGEAFTASPLTRDTETIRSILKVLTPQIMPAQGSRADLGLVKAHELLKQAGIKNGQVLLIADGVSQKPASLSAAINLRKDGHRVSVMAVGTEVGGKLNFRNNTSVSVKLEAESLNDIANRGGGNYHLMTTNNTDLKQLLTSITDNSSLEEKQNTNKSNNDNQEIQNREWHSTGPLLVLLLLPFAALAFRRGWLLNVAMIGLLIGLVSQPYEVIAAENDKQIDSQLAQQSKWDVFTERLSKNKAQRANQALLNQQYEKARDLSDDPLERGSAEYKLKNYEEALSNFKQAKGADARYNEANTLAKLQKYEEAITAYDEALKLNLSMQDALDNKKVIEDFLKQQQQSGKDSQSSNENQEGSSDAENDQQNSQNSDSQNKQDEKNDSKSVNKDGSQEQQNEKDANDKNQFSEADKNLDKNKEKADKEELQATEHDDDKDRKSKDEKGETENKEQKLTVANEDKEKDSATINETQNKTKEPADELSQEEKMAAEQWLRRIPDDPGGLLKRKFRYQYNQNRRNSNANSTEQPW